LDIQEQLVGTRPSVEELAIWQSEFDKTAGAKGYKLIGFRQTSDESIFAIIAKSN